MMNFGQAIEVLKLGHRVRRVGWNGKNMFIYLVSGSIRTADELRNEAKEHVAEGLTAFSAVRINSHIDMKAADGSIVVGWLASQTDMLADDWEVLE